MMIAPFAAGSVVLAAAPRAPEAAVEPTPAPVRLSAAELFAFSDAAIAVDDLAAAETALRALLNDPIAANRNEARFRLASICTRQGRLADAAVLLRRIIDEQPDAQRARLELASVLERLGDEQGARRVFREAQAAGLPLEVAQVVDGYLARLQSRQKAGVALELALAPDSNINQATVSDTLSTVFGDFRLDDRARRTSGVGLFIGADAFARTSTRRSWDLFVRAAAKSNTYGKSEFNTLTASLTAGTELRLGSRRVTLQSGVGSRALGGEVYSASHLISVDVLRPLGRRSQISLNGVVEDIDNRLNPLQSGTAYSATISFERALSASSGVGGSISGERENLRDPGYSTTSGQLTAFAYRTVHRATLVGTVTYGRLAADERQFIYPDKREDELLQVSLSLTDRRHAWRGFAPVVRLVAERNMSSIEIFEYDRVRSSFGLSKAF